MHFDGSDMDTVTPQGAVTRSGLTGNVHGQEQNAIPVASNVSKQPSNKTGKRKGSESGDGAPRKRLRGKQADTAATANGVPKAHRAEWDTSVRCCMCKRMPLHGGQCVPWIVGRAPRAYYFPIEGPKGLRFSHSRAPGPIFSKQRTSAPNIFPLRALGPKISHRRA